MYGRGPGKRAGLKLVNKSVGFGSFRSGKVRAHWGICSKDAVVDEAWTEDCRRAVEEEEEVEGEEGRVLRRRRVRVV